MGGHGTKSPTDQPVFSNNPRPKVVASLQTSSRNIMNLKASITQVTEQQQEIAFLPVPSECSITKKCGLLTHLGVCSAYAAAVLSGNVAAEPL